MAQFEFVSWLVKWILEKDSFDFDWDHVTRISGMESDGIKRDCFFHQR